MQTHKRKQLVVKRRVFVNQNPSLQAAAMFSARLWISQSFGKVRRLKRCKAEIVELVGATKKLAINVSERQKVGPSTWKTDQFSWQCLDIESLRQHHRCSSSQRSVKGIHPPSHPFHSHFLVQRPESHMITMYMHRHNSHFPPKLLKQCVKQLVVLLPASLMVFLFKVWRLLYKQLQLYIKVEKNE